MRIGLVHSFYSSALPSGENAIVLEQAEALRNAGHEVLLVSRRTDDDEKQPLYRIRSAGRVLTGMGPDPTEELRAFAPDVVHVHNLFPNFGTRWLRSWRGPLVATLHNFRPMCANGLLFRDGHYCDECPTRSNLAAVRHGCYHGSRTASIPLALRNARGPSRSEVLARADALICLSQQAADLYRRLTHVDLPIRVVPNGIDVPLSSRAPQPNGRWLVVSRLTPEKGVRELVAIWPDGEALDIIGAGPEEGVLRLRPRPGVTLLGARSRGDVLGTMPDYEGLVFSSRCLEMQPTVLAEAATCGLPVVALAGSAGDSIAATTYHDARSLQSALTTVRAHRSTRQPTNWDPAFAHASWVRNLLDVYITAGAHE